MTQTMAYVANTAGDQLLVQPITRRALRPDDVSIRVSFCGVCHTDVHALAATDPAAFPLVPGHEFVGEVTAVGANVEKFSIGDPVAVGNIVDSCGVCDMCVAHQENYCMAFPTLTYGGFDRHDGERTLGAYSTDYVASERFVYHLPSNLDPAGAAPLMCAGITVWEPLRRWSVGPGMSVGIVGLGGLGHLAVKLAHALGADVTVFTTSAKKYEDALALGASDVIVSTDPGAMAAGANRFDVILDTVAVAHDLSPYLRALALDGTLCTLGSLGSMEFEPMALLVGRKSLASAGSGGTKGTQEMLDFCAAHDIVADVEVIPAHDVDTALARLAANDVRYRFALDMTQL